VFADVFGDKVAQDVQDMGMSAKITIPLIAYDSSILQSIMNRGDRGAFGQFNTPGLPLNAMGWTISMYITGLWTAWPGIPANQGVWKFFNCYVTSESQRLSTKASPFQLEVATLPNAGYAVQVGTNIPFLSRSIT
jgi:hypothetical protein